MASDSNGAVLLAEGAPQGALRVARRAWTVWQEVDAPYDAARSRVQIGLACRSLGDDETATLELAAARQVLVQLGAAPDVARARDRRDDGGPPRAQHLHQARCFVALGGEAFAYEHNRCSGLHGIIHAASAAFAHFARCAAQTRFRTFVG